MAGRKSIIGSSVCIGVAVASALLFKGRVEADVRPLLFLSVILLVASYFGTLAGLVGSIASAFVFSVFLFPPIGSMVVQDSAERSSVAWMLLGGLVISYFAAGSDSKPRSQH